MANDIIKVTITEDCVVKLDTDRISLPNHSLAEDMVRAIATVAGGKTERKSKHKHGTTGHHTHEGEHDHEHH